jgi:hypothetical protein
MAHEAVAVRRAPLRSWRYAFRPPPGHGFSTTTAVFAAPWAGGRWRDFCGGEERRPQGHARSAHVN